MQVKPSGINSRLCSIMQLQCCVGVFCTIVARNNELHLIRGPVPYQTHLILPLSLYLFILFHPPRHYSLPLGVSLFLPLLVYFFSSSFTTSSSPAFSYAATHSSHPVLFLGLYSITGFPNKERIKNTICILDHVCDVRGKLERGERGGGEGA